MSDWDYDEFMDAHDYDDGDSNEDVVGEAFQNGEELFADENGTLWGSSDAEWG